MSYEMANAERVYGTGPLRATIPKDSKNSLNLESLIDPSFTKSCISILWGPLMKWNCGSRWGRLWALSVQL